MDNQWTVTDSRSALKNVSLVLEVIDGLAGHFSFDCFPAFLDIAEDLQDRCSVLRFANLHHLKIKNAKQKKNDYD